MNAHEYLDSKGKLYETLLDYACKVFDSCTTYDQMMCGLKYLELAAEKDSVKYPMFAMAAVSGRRNITCLQGISERTR